jgi:hypothetical protein
MEIEIVIRLRLVKEYLATPIFCANPEIMGHLEVDVLPITDSLKDDLKNWYNQYQATFFDDYPPDSRFSSPYLEAMHAKIGEDLAKKLRIELGDGYSVEYNI